MSISKPLSDEEAIQKLTGSELAVGEAALANGPVTVDLAYLHQNPNPVEINSLPELGRRLNGLKEDVRTLVTMRLGGNFMASREEQSA